jgi:hypothetical protein
VDVHLAAAFAHGVGCCDIEEMEAKMAENDWAAAKAIYDNGKNSKKSDTVNRKISGFTLKPLEPFGKLYTDYNTATLPKGYSPHALVTDALVGADSDITGAWGTGSIASKKDFRSQVVKKVIKFQIVMLYALHEMEAALVNYKDSAKTEAIHALDEWWVFYAGSLEDGKASGYSTYILAEKRGTFFGTDSYDAGNGGKSKVNAILLDATNEFKKLLKTDGNAVALENILKCVRAQLKVPLIQGCIQYAYKTDTATVFPGEKTAARKGELWVFCSGVLPFLHEVNPADAAKLREETDIVPIDEKTPSFDKIKAVFSADNLNKMGIKCADVGGFVDKSADKTSATTLGSDFTLCKDGTVSNDNADSAQCTGTWLSVPRISAASANGSAHTFYALSVLMSVALAVLH